MYGKSFFTITLLLFTLSLFWSSCYFTRSIIYNTPSLDDYKKFPEETIERSANPWSFKERPGDVDPGMPVIIQNGNVICSFDRFLEQRQTVAFLLVRNDTIIYERYFKGYSRTSILPSFSVAKSFISALVDIAIKDGTIKSINQSITDFLPELADPGFQGISLKDLLEMRSGIDFNEDYLNPAGGIAKFYYGRNLRAFCLRLKISDKAGEVYKYQSANAQLLALAIERATGKSIPVYFDEKIWKPLGAQYDATWNLDSPRNKEVKAFCCLNARAVDFAKFGRLYLNSGLWNGDSVVSSNWVRESLTIQNDSRDSEHYPYTYSWRVTAGGDFFAKGVGGQYIYVCPHNNTIIVRFGKKYAHIPWPAVFEKLCDAL